MNLTLLQNSLILAVSSAVVALALAFPVALAAEVSGRWGRRALIGASLVTLVQPGFFVSGMWMEWVGFAGAWHLGAGWISDTWMPLLMSGWVLSLLLWPIGALLLIGAWDRVDARMLEAEPGLRGGALMRHLLWPVVRPALVGPGVLIAILAMTNFSVPALFQARVWPAEVWMEYATRFDAWSAWSRCWPLVVLVVGGLFWFGRSYREWPGRSARAESRQLAEHLGSWRCRVTVALAWGVVLVACGFPMATALANPRTWTEFLPALHAALPAAMRTLFYASFTASIVVAGALVLSPSRWGMPSVVPFVVPGVFTGIVLAEVAGGSGWSTFRESGAIVVTGLVIRYLFVGWLVIRQSWLGADRRLREWVRGSGGGTLAIWRHVVLPVAGWPLAGAWFVVYLLSLWDVETQILVVPPGGDTLGLMIFNLLHYGHNAQVTALCLMLGVIALLPLAFGLLVRAWNGRGARGGWGAVALAGCLTGGCTPRDAASTAADVSSRLFQRVEVIGGKGTGAGYFSKPRSLAVTGSGDVYVVDMTGRVQRFDAEGRWISLWQMPETALGKPKGMDALPGGGVLVVEPHYHRVNRFDADGRLMGYWGEHGTNAGQIWFPRAVAVASDGTCFVSEYGRRERIQRFRVEDGTFLLGFGEEGSGPGQLNRAEGLGVGPRDEVYVADSCNHRIQVFSAEGRFLRMHGRAGQGAGEFSYPYDVRVDGDGRQYVCEFGNSRVQVLGPDDRPLEMLGGPGVSPASMNNPWSLYLDGKGNLYIADALNHRVVKYVRRAGVTSAGAAAGATGAGDWAMLESGGRH